MINVQSEHWVLLLGILSLTIGLFIDMFFNAGIVVCILSYCIDLFKRVEIGIILDDLPESLKKQAD